METILVTGGAGFIGSHCVDRLLARGDKVICVDNFNTFYDPEIKRKNIQEHLKNQNYTLVEADIADAQVMEKVIAQKPDKILHLAGRAGIQYSLKDPLEYVRSNITGTATILEAARTHGVKDVVFASSSSVYGGNTKVSFSEEDNVDNPYSPYAATKRTCEILGANYNHVAGMHIVALRFFTVYGPRNRPDLAIFKFSEGIEQEKEITIYGTDDEIKRDWTFVGDTVNGILAALDNCGKMGFEIINLGNANPISVTYLVRLLEKELGKKAKIKRAPLPVGDVPITSADVSKAKRLLDWEPKTPIEQGIKEFVKWYKSQQSL